MAPSWTQKKVRNCTANLMNFWSILHTCGWSAVDKKNFRRIFPPPMKTITQKFNRLTLRAWHFANPSAMDLVHLQNGSMTSCGYHLEDGPEEVNRL